MTTSSRAAIRESLREEANEAEYWHGRREADSGLRAALVEAREFIDHYDSGGMDRSEWKSNIAFILERIDAALKASGTAEDHPNSTAQSLPNIVQQPSLTTSKGEGND